jgi:hypothetical protein
MIARRHSVSADDYQLEHSEAMLQESQGMGSLMTGFN